MRKHMEGGKMMKSESDVMYEYIMENHKQAYEELTGMEKILFLMSVDQSVSFKKYLLRYRIKEFVRTILRKDKSKYE